MDRYSALAREHFFNPRNVGDIDSAGVAGRAGSFSCGATLRITLQVDESQRIAQARFKAAGCSFLVASASFLTEKVKGHTTGEAAAMAQSPARAICDPLGLIPAGKAQCGALACEALISAIAVYSDSVREEWAGDEALICTCFGVSERTLEGEIRAGALRTISEVTKACNAGAGCRSCHSLIEEILQDWWRTEGLPNREHRIKP